MKKGITQLTRNIIVVDCDTRVRGFRLLGERLVCESYVLSLLISSKELSKASLYNLSE